MLAAPPSALASVFETDQGLRTRVFMRPSVLRTRSEWSLLEKRRIVIEVRSECFGGDAAAWHCAAAIVSLAEETGT